MPTEIVPRLPVLYKMPELLAVPLISKNGIRGKVLTPSRLLDMRREKSVVFETGREALVPSDRLHLRSDGSYFLDLTVDPRAPDSVQSDVRSTELIERESTGGSTPVLPNSDVQNEIIIPRVEEQLEVGKRTVETGRVRIQKSVVETPVTIDEPSIYEEYEVERVPINRVVEKQEPTRVEGSVTIVPVYEEEVVTTKQLVLREELRLVKKLREERSPQTLTLRKENVDVERIRYDRPRSTE